MLFTSLEFLFAFLPLTFAGFFLIARSFGKEAAAAWLAVASIFFYGWWSTTYLPLLLGSIAFNYAIGFLVAKSRDASARVAKLALICGVIGNLALLCHYKYSGFFLGEISKALGAREPILDIVLPLGISFFTFTQIAFLVDAWKGKAKEYSFLHYLLFVTWFPHLIAGPILHHGEMMPQFRRADIYKPNARNITIGLVLLTVGLSKKLMIADPISAFADPVFDAAHAGQAIDLYAAWIGATSYAFQIYFDFSGYSDMAVGLSLMFGIRLPINFNSPYKSKSIIEFWRRWHMTLSNFLRDYLYVPLGGNRLGESRRLFNLMATMLLGGLWHGANWTFIIWGALHGLYLCINHAFQKMKAASFSDGLGHAWFFSSISVVFTFLLVVVAWVFFRAEDVSSALSIIQGMAGLHEPSSWSHTFAGQSPFLLGGCVFAAAIVTWCFPNAYEMLEWLDKKFDSEVDGGSKVVSALGISSAIMCMLLMSVSILSSFGTSVASPFLYFQF